jgi:hypothetical protein
MKCRWSTVQPGDDCGRDAVPDQQLCAQHLRDVCDMVKPPKAKSGCLKRYADRIALGMLSAAGGDFYDALSKVGAVIDTITEVVRDDGTPGVEVTLPNGQRIPLPDPGDSAPQSLPAEWRDVSQRALQLMMEMSRSSVRVRIIAGPGAPGDPTLDNRLDAMPAEQLDAMLFHARVAGKASTPELDHRLACDGVIHFGRGGLTSWGGMLYRTWMKRQKPNA